MADDTSTPKHASSWDELHTEFKELDEVKSYTDFLVVCHELDGKLRLEDWDLVSHHLKGLGADPAAHQKAEKPKEHTQETSQPKNRGFWLGDVDIDGKQAQYADQDRRLEALERLLQIQWKKQNPKEDDLSKKKIETFQNVTLDENDEFSKWTTNFISTESVIRTQAKEALKFLDPKAFERYEENERTRVYGDMGRDPVYIKALLTAKERTQKAYEQAKAQNMPGAAKHIEVVFMNEQLRAFYEIAKEYPEKFRAYGKTNSLIGQALSLQRPPEVADFFMVIRAQTLQPANTVNQRRAQGEKFLHAKMLVLEHQIAAGIGDKEKQQQLLATLETATKRLREASEDEVYKQLDQLHTVLDSNPFGTHDAKVIKGLIPAAPVTTTLTPPINPYDIASAIKGTTINLGQYRKEIPITREDTEEEIDEEYEGDEAYEEGYQERYPGEPDDEYGDEGEEEQQDERRERQHPREDRGGGDDYNRGGDRTSRMGRGNPLGKARQAKNLLNKLGNLRGMGGGGPGGILKFIPKGLPPLPPQVYLVIGLIILAIVALIIIILVFLYVFGTEATKDTELLPEVTITKRGPASISNGQRATYEIDVFYPGAAQTVLVTDKLPPGTRLIEEETTQPFTYNPVTREVSWSLKDIQLGGAAGYVTGAREFPQDKFQDYGFPPPEDGAVTMVGEVVSKWQTRMSSHAIRASQLTGVDVGLLGMWPWLEGINYNNYYENCNDLRPYTAEADDDPNTPCPYLNWQVGFGVRPMETLDYLKEAMANMHPGKTPKEIGQAVMDRSGSESVDDVITYPWETFPDVTIDEILDGIERGVGADAGKDDRRYRPSDTDLKMRSLAAILMKDPAVSTYVLAKVFQRIQGPGLADIMEGWPGSYDRQRVINYVYALYKAGVGGDGTFFSAQTLSLTLEPEQADVYITNQATAQVIGAVIPGDETEDLPDPENAPPNDDNCSGFYAFFYMPDGYQKNFGDPLCSLRVAKDDGTVVVDQEKVAAKLNELDEDDAQIWLTVVIPCVSQFQPNEWLADDTEYGRWGLFAMGSTSPPFGAGNGPNGTHDRGDVIWVKQIINAVNYNKDLEGRNQKWQYWPEECRPK